MRWRRRDRSGARARRVFGRCCRERRAGRFVLCGSVVSKFGPGVWRPLAGVTFMTPRVFRSARSAERVARKVYRERGGVVGVLGPVDDVQVACELLAAPEDL